jgi:hypothetical protein
MTHTLIVISNVNVPLSEGQWKPGTLSAVYSGDVLTLEDEVAQKLLTYYPDSFHVHLVTDEKPVVEKVEPTEDTKLIVDLQVDSAKLAESEAEVVIPLESDAHHSTVKAYVLDLEEANPVDLARIKAVKARYPNYASVIAECDRILEANGAV